MNSIHAVQLAFLALIVCAGLMGFVVFRSRRSRLLAVSGIAVLGIGLLSTLMCIIWDGGFCRAEFRITFQDAEGNPVEGVELHVENEHGFEFFHYPVTDYLPDQMPRSDHNGVLTFHHATYSALEFGGSCYHLFFIIPLGEHDSPVFICRFLHAGQEVYRIPYSKLNTDAWDFQTVKRRWQWPEWPYHALEQHQVTEDVNAARLPLYDKNRTGKLERDEAVASWATLLAYERV